MEANLIKLVRLLNVNFHLIARLFQEPLPDEVKFSPAAKACGVEDELGIKVASVVQRTFILFIASAIVNSCNKSLILAQDERWRRV